MTAINSVAGLNTKYAKLNNAEPQTEAPKPVDAPKTNELAKDTVSFSGHNEEEKVEKHPFAAVASFISPGTGQMMNGQVGKGLKQGLVQTILATPFVAALVGIPVHFLKSCKKHHEELSEAIKEGIAKTGKSKFNLNQAEFNKIEQEAKLVVKELPSNKVKYIAAATLGAVSFVAALIYAAHSAKDAYNGGHKEA